MVIIINLLTASTIHKQTHQSSTQTRKRELSNGLPMVLKHLLNADGASNSMHTLRTPTVTHFKSPEDGF